MAYPSSPIDLTSSPAKGLSFADVSTPLELSAQELEALDAEFVAENLVSNWFYISFLFVIYTSAGR